jgi:DNA-binding MarR family transcriptional regulator
MDADTWDRVVTLHGRVEREIAKAMQRRHGVGLSEFRALRMLATAPDGELRMQDLADRLGLDQSSVSRLAARLDTAGLTRRDLCPDDRRGVYTVITSAGRALHDTASPTYREELVLALERAAAEPRTGALVAALGGEAPA